jgi:hypothetical protein
MGLVPAKAAMAAWERRRPACDQLTSTWAALRGADAGASSSQGRPHRPARSVRPGAGRPRPGGTGCAGRVRHEQALAGLLIQSLKLCAAADMVRLGLVALDGTKIEANAAAAANRTHAPPAPARRQPHP